MVRKTATKRIVNPRLALSIVLVVIIAAVVAGILYHHSNQKNVSIIPSVPTNSASNQKNNPDQSSPSQVVSQSNSDKTPASTGFNSPSQSESDAGNNLIVPTGNFVSNHQPAADNTREQSVCNTTSGASCYIKFTNGNTVKQLAAETTDSTGAAYWTWDINDAGLTSGSWTVTAVATLNGQTKTANDANQLVVQ